MQHTNARQCLDSIRTRLEYLETEVMKRDKVNRKLEARHAELQCHYAEVEQEKEELGQTIRDLEKPKPDDRKIYTTRLYWDCNCETHYIQPRWQTECLDCGANKDDQPDSRLGELSSLELANLNHYADMYVHGGK